MRGPGGPPGGRPPPMGRGPKRNKARSNRKGTFDPTDTKNVEHHQIGVWDLYLQKEPKLQYVPGAPVLEEWAQMLQDLPYLWRTIQDVGRADCWTLLIIYGFIILGQSLMPAVTLWFSGQLLKIVQTAVDSRQVDKTLLFRVAAGRIFCTVLTRLLHHFGWRISTTLNGHIKRFYSVHIFKSMIRLDVPTSEDPNVARQIDAIVPTDRYSVPWSALSSMSTLLGTIVKLVGQAAVLAGVLRNQRDGPLLAVLSLSEHLFWWAKGGAHIGGSSGVWAATTFDEDFMRMEAMKRLVSNESHRKEIVAGNFSEYLTNQYRELTLKLGNRAGDFWSLYNDWKSQSLFSLLSGPIDELPQIVFTLRAVQYPSSIPVSLASLNLIQQTAQSFSHTISWFVREVGSVSERLANLRRLYEAENIQNRIEDGTVPYPEDEQSVKSGIALEFRNVSFKYPGSPTYAVRNVSFKIESGQLCVIVGTNGSGKSTILKLISRVYDPTEGEILIDGKDIKTLKLVDLRRAMALLFQDYTHFPLSIRENIALGDPDNAQDDERIRLAARLGGAEEIIDRLPQGFDTYLERPVRDIYSGLPEGTKTLFGRSVDFGNIRGNMGGGDGGAEAPNKVSLSGGQMQRLAVARTFMRSSSEEQKVGLLLFDEPSASLDPTAEHDLFARLRELRGNKTMVFSTHRFGNLTRHADVILYMNDSVIVETGTHDGLLKHGGEYAKLWRLQAQAFLGE